MFLRIRLCLNQNGRTKRRQWKNSCPVDERYRYLTDCLFGMNRFIATGHERLFDYLMTAIRAHHADTCGFMMIRHHGGMNQSRACKKQRSLREHDVSDDGSFHLASIRYKGNFEKRGKRLPLHQLTSFVKRCTLLPLRKQFRSVCTLKKRGKNDAISYR